ncbi:rege-1, partial [Pristionchus pacificus]
GKRERGEDTSHPEYSSMHRPLCRASGSARGILTIDDSSYESCSEDSHSSLSRQTSGHGNWMGDSMVSSSLSSELSSISIDNDVNMKHALSLGYLRKEVEKAIIELGSETTQESLLSWLLLNSSPSSLCDRPLSQSDSSLLRPIIIDGSNIALTHGRRSTFSCSGIRECISFFEQRGHNDILVFLPAYRRETPRSHAPVSDHHILEELDRKGYIVWTPSRRIEGRRIVCHDDRYIIKTAYEKEGIVVSNDEFREMAKEDPLYRRVIEKRLLMYSFVDGRFMPPEDPLGRGGPTLHQFLSTNAAVNTQMCPYGKKCTFGNKCKFLHSEKLKLSLVKTGGQLQKGLDNGTTGVANDCLMSRNNVIRTNSLDPSIEKEDTRKASAIPSHMKHSELIRNKSAPIESPSIPPPSLFTPSHAIWGRSELSVGPISSPQSCQSERERLFFHLSNVFPSSSVKTVMESNPDIQDPRKLCESILQLHRGFESPLKSPSNEPPK